MSKRAQKVQPLFLLIALPVDPREELNQTVAAVRRPRRPGFAALRPGEAIQELVAGEGVCGPPERREAGCAGGVSSIAFSAGRLSNTTSEDWLIRGMVFDPTGVELKLARRMSVWVSRWVR